MRYTRILSSRYTVDPTSLALTDVAHVVPPQTVGPDTAVYPVLVSGPNQTVLVTSSILAAGAPTAVGDFIPSRLAVRLIHPDTEEARHVQYTADCKWPQPMLGYKAVIVDETLVIIGGFVYASDTAAVPRHPVFFQDMWCLTLHNIDNTDRWTNVSMKEVPGKQVFGYTTAVCNIADSAVAFLGPMSVSVALNGHEAITMGVLTDTRIQLTLSRNWNVAVNLGPFICLFGTITQETLGEDEDGTRCVCMYDIVSGDFTLYEPLPFPGKVVSACMLNPTTMLLVQKERTLVLELDPELFNIYADVD
ncbi:hypothetical protein KIPB_013056 [Kipferlia bialata]|uniref:Uncharacterized protein n=1 Tax=Kipferlia bialata TaxID=797122 RepID=A0A391NS05_9EUKA|nr:hypothetical protein KIPB_013056 [Kipferlia bialata]|eukprot:g13056.t1